MFRNIISDRVNNFVNIDVFLLTNLLTMKNIHLLIQHDIKLAKLIYALRDLDIDANSYFSDNVVVVFELLNVTKTDEKIDNYLSLLEIESRLEIPERADQILKTIKQWKE